MSEQMMQLVNKPNRIRTNSTCFNTHVIEVYEPLESPTDWSDELHLINTCGPDDTIVLDLCTPGGCGDTAFLFNRALRSTEAHTIAIIGPQCSSAGSILALSCDEFILDETSELMCHTSHFGIVGKEVDVYEHVVFSRQRLKKLFDIVYSGFCTPEEISMLIDGTPKYFEGEDLVRRLNNLREYRESQREKQSCGEENFSEGAFNEINLEEMIDSAVESGVQKALDKILKKFDLTPKAPKPARKKIEAKASYKIDKVVVENVEAFNSRLEKLSNTEHAVN